MAPNNNDPRRDQTKSALSSNQIPLVSQLTKLTKHLRIEPPNIPPGGLRVTYQKGMGPVLQEYYCPHSRRWFVIGEFLILDDGTACTCSFLQCNSYVRPKDAPRTNLVGNPPKREPPKPDLVRRAKDRLGKSNFSGNLEELSQSDRDILLMTQKAYLAKYPRKSS